LQTSKFQKLLYETTMRKVLHIDMDSFFAAIEQRDFPELRGKPIAVGGSGPRSVVATASYEARVFGVRSALPMAKAQKLCASLVVVPPRFPVYRAESQKIQKILQSYSPLVEPLSLDEAYLDVSHQTRFAWDIAKDIRQEIFTATGLTASAGVAPNKMLAKIASDWRKPNGQFAIPPERVEAFLKDLPVRKIHGVGPRGAEKLKAMGIETCGQLAALEQWQLEAQFGIWGKELRDLARGLDPRPVVPERPRKSLSTENTYAHDLPDLASCSAALQPLIEELRRDLARTEPDRPVSKVFVKVKFSNFQTTTREAPAPEVEDALCQRLLAEAWERSPNAARLLGVGVRFCEPLKTDQRQLELPFSEQYRSARAL
jgi:DNA polymerase IV